MPDDPESIAAELAGQGYVVLPDVFSADEVRFFRDRLEARYRDLGSPGTYARPPLEPAPDVEVSPVGMVFHRLGGHFPEFGPRLFKPTILRAAEEVLGAGYFFEYAGGVICEGQRPFFDWHAHMGGVDNGRYRKEEIFPSYEGAERIGGVLYLDDTAPAGASTLRVMPRQVGEPTRPPFDPKVEDWDGQVELPCRPGTVVLLDQCTWHAVTTKETPGLRAFIAFYFTSPSSPPPSWLDTTFADGARDAGLPASVFPLGRDEASTGNGATVAARVDGGGTTAIPDFEGDVAAAIERASGGAWRASRIYFDRGALTIPVHGRAQSEHEEQHQGGELTLEVRSDGPEVRSYRASDGLAFSYRSAGSLPKEHHPRLDACFAALAQVLGAHAFDPSREVIPSRTESPAVFPTPYQRFYLEGTAAVSAEAVEAYRRDGHVLVRRALAPDVVFAARRALWPALERRLPDASPAPGDRPDAYARSFTQITDLGLSDAAVRAFTHAPRIAAMAAQLMGVETVHVFCEDWLIKGPGADITPWHQDEAVFPFDSPATVTCWIPLQAIREGEGLLRFGRGSQGLGLAPVEDINDESEAQYGELIREHGFTIDRLPPVFVGDVSFHDGKTIHGAYPNEGPNPRLALALHCFAGGATFKEPTTPKMALIMRHSAPAGRVGAAAVSDRWPVVYGGGAPASGLGAADAGEALHIRGTSIAEGGAPIDLWLARGRLHRSPITGAQEYPLANAFLSAGLTECHGHLSYPHRPDDAASTEGWMNTRRREYAVTGVSLVRDMGAVDDAISELTDIPGLPRVQAAGNMVLPADQWPFEAVPPERLVRAFAERVERGARWVKVFCDFTSDYGGKLNTGFTGDDRVSYPLPLLREAIDVARSLGGRVAAHCFTAAGTEVAVRAGVDSLEHGWGLTPELVREIADHGIAWAPLAGIARPMWDIARRDDQASRVAWIEDTMERLATLLPLAEDRRVQLLAGTDLFPEVSVADEIRQLHELGVSRGAALAAGSWGARAWLGEPGLEEGAPADLVIFRRDPREDLEALFEPHHIILGGQQVAPSFAARAGRYRSWRERGD